MLNIRIQKYFIQPWFFYSLDGLPCVLNASLKKYMSCFALETNRSLEITLKMRFGEFVCVWSGIFFFFFFFFFFCCSDSPVLLWFVSSVKIVNLDKIFALCPNKKTKQKGSERTLLKERKLAIRHFVAGACGRFYVFDRMPL